MTNKELAEYIGIIRYENKLTVTDIAKKARVGRSRLSNIINDEEEYQLEEKASSVLTKLKLTFPNSFEYKKIGKKQIIDSMPQTKQNVPRETGGSVQVQKREQISEKDVLVTLMETMTQLMKTQNKLLEEQKDNVVSKISTIESNLGSVEAGVQNIGLRYRVDREVMMKSLARIEKAPDPALLIKEADNMLLSLTQDSVTRDKKK